MSGKILYSMGELAEMFDVKPSLIRYWEAQFKVLKPERNKKGNRLFSAEDVEKLKLIYHLVKERGMTLEGAKKAMRRQNAETEVSRDAELMERLQHIRSLLVEVREDLKSGEGVVLSDAEGAEGVSGEDGAAAQEHPAPRKGRKAVVKITEEPAEGAENPAVKAARKPRRKKGDEENKELFAFYEQSLF